jgi:nucleoside-diphosphate-sugar epimerase
MAKKSTDRGTLIVGCGYIGSRVSQMLVSAGQGGPVYAMTRNRAKADQLAVAGFEPIVADWTDRRTLAHLPACDRVLVAVSYDARSGIPRDAAQVGGLRNLLDFVNPDTDICYLSTTGVFHQADGRWVDETSPARPIGEGGIAHLRAESLLHRHRPGGRWTILRLAGIYGPGRIPRVNDVIQNRPIDGPYTGFLNLIHRDDAAEAILATWQLARPHRLYLVGDDAPVIRSTFYEKIATLTRSPAPIFRKTETPSLSARSGGNKRIWNRRMRRDLLPKMHFPTYAEGLTDLLV